jgi:tetratricopeptide (TPR) repeat protein
MRGSQFSVVIFGCLSIAGCGKGSPPASSSPATIPSSTPAAPGTGTAAAAKPSAPQGPTLGDLNKVGAVELKTSCAAGVQKDFDRGVALLHSFFYEEARRIFTEVATQDPSCAMAQWGIAQTLWHPLWTAPTNDELTKGRDAAKKAGELGGKTDVEKGLIAAMQAFYEAESKPGGGPAGQTCHGPIGGDHRSRAVAYEKKMEQLYAANKDNVEVGTFYALALLGTAPPTDKTFKNQNKATEILEKFWTSHRTHPGVAHYLIHGYDYPPLAKKGLPAAEAYADMAPWVPHVQHMPSHIFVRLGRWPEVLKSNLASADAAQQYAKLRHPEATSFEELHALDYLAYGYLQQGDDAAAAAVAEQVRGVKKTFPEVDFVVAYAMGAIPARYTLERRAYTDAAQLTVPDAPYWAKFPFAKAGIEFAIGVGAARTGKVAEAKAALAALEASAAATQDSRHEYFASQVRMQAKTVTGLIQYAEGKQNDAVKTLRAAADADDALGKHPVSPGSLIPSRELLADILLDMKKPADALKEYEACLALNPNRFNSLHGAGRAAELANKADAARKHYQALVAQLAQSASRPELEQVRTFLAKQK